MLKQFAMSTVLSLLLCTSAVLSYAADEPVADTEMLEAPSVVCSCCPSEAAENLNTIGLGIFSILCVNLGSSLFLHWRG